MVYVHHTFSLCFILCMNGTCSVCKFTMIEHHPNENVKNTAIFCFWPIQIETRILTTTKSFLITISPAAFLNEPPCFIWTMTDTSISVSPTLLGTMGTATDLASRGGTRTFPIEESSRFCAIEQKSWSPLRYNLAWWGEHETSEQYCLIRL